MAQGLRWPRSPTLLLAPALASALGVLGFVLALFIALSLRLFLT